MQSFSKCLGPAKECAATAALFVLGMSLSMTMLVATTLVGSVQPALASDQPGALTAGGVQPFDEEPVPSTVATVATPIKAGQAALASAQTQIHNHKLLKAATSLATVRTKLVAAHKAAMVFVNNPPSDPETNPNLSASVVAVFAFEHQIVMGLVDEFDGRKNTTIVSAMDTTITRAMNKRDVMMNAIIPLDPDGVGAGLADDMPDTLTIYSKEVTTITTELNTSTLIASARTALQDALTHAKATNAKVNATWGGGE
jgi:hypothetical protein